MSRHPASTAGWFATRPTDAPGEPRESDDDVLREVPLHFQKHAVVHDGADEIAHVVRLVRLGRHEPVERSVLAVHRIGRRAGAADRQDCSTADSSSSSRIS